MPVGKRYQQYCDKRIRAKLPVVGSRSLFEKRELGAENHAKCELCGGFEVEIDILKECRMDGQSKESRADVLKRRVPDNHRLRHEQHAKEQRAERNYVMDIARKAGHTPAAATALNIDAPTQDQFDIPVQNRKARDVVKSLEGELEWKWKITSVIAEGFGMMAYVTRFGLGSRPNLTCTTLCLTLLLVAEKRGLGERLNILFDNNSGDNKNNEVIACIPWLILIDVFHAASDFCMLKGHTFRVASLLAV
eukprot:2297322-Pleurochrysis_carterae.AAC.3